MGKNKNSSGRLYSSLDGSSWEPLSQSFESLVASQEKPYGYQGDPPPSAHANQETLDCIDAQKKWLKTFR